MKEIITFDESAKLYILDVLKITTDKENYIIEKDNPEQRILTPDGEEIAINDFAGVRKGSLAFIKSDLNSIISLSDYLKK